MHTSPFPLPTDATHREVHTRLITAGWSTCGIGDWATTFRSPDGRQAARVCPFDPAYPVYVELCRRLPGHRLLPDIGLDQALDGGGRVTVMEFLTPADAETAAKVTRDWEAGTDPALAEVRRAAEALNTEAAAKVPWWDGLDLNAGNIMVSLSGQTKLVDMFCMDGEGMYGTLLSDPAALAARIPAHARRHMTDIAFIARTSTPAEIAALRQAATAAG